MHNGTGLITPRGSGSMSSSRKALQTLQMSSEKSVISVSKKDDHVKLQPKFKRSGKKRKHSEKDDHVKLQPKANTETISNKTDSEQPSRTALNEHKENLEVKLSSKEKFNSNNQIKLIEDKKKTFVSKCDAIIEELSSTSDHDKYSYDEKISWMFTKEHPERYYKASAFSRGIELEKALQKNEELFGVAGPLLTKTNSLISEIELKNKIILEQHDELKSQLAEIKRLREITEEVERIHSVLEELTEGMDE